MHRTPALAPTLALPLAILACSNGAEPDAGADAGADAPAAGPATLETQGDLITYQAYELPNGLDVVLHQDSSDPVVAVNLAVHVGSGREEPGRTGFAHLFEHLLFLDSENLGYGGLDSMNTRIGGEGTNGFTTTDMTQYFQAVPRDALEKVIWAEADKIGYFIQTVSDDVFANEKQVVKNEKRQRVDNQPYGHNFAVLGAALYPPGHPYHHQVIGSLEDLDAATLDDVRAFYSRYYGPENVTFTVSGDFDPEEARQWIDKYFGEIPRGPGVAEPEARPSGLASSVNLVHEDAFAQVPQLTLAWPTVASEHRDAVALDVLASYLADGREAPLYAAVVDEANLAPDVTAFHNSRELAGEMYVLIRTNAGVDIDALSPALEAAWSRFERDGIPEAALERIKAGLETELYNGLQSALGKSIALGEANTLHGNPGWTDVEVARLRALTPADIRRAYDTHIAGRARVSTSFVPEGAPELALQGATPAEEVEETIVEGEGAAVEFDPTARTIATPTPSGFDRTVEPAFGEPYALPAPEVRRTQYANGLEVLLNPSREVPLVAFELRLDAGRVRAPGSNPGLAGLAAGLLERGTATRTPTELENAIRNLGSEIDVFAADTAAVARGQSLARNLGPTLALAREMVFEPRFDAEEFERLRSQRAEGITQAMGDPNSLARAQLARLQHPQGSPLREGGPTGFGSRDALEATTLEDVRRFYADHYTLDGAQLLVAGDASLAQVAQVWDDNDLPHGRDGTPAEVRYNPVEAATIYFLDVPGAKQSVIRAFRPALAAGDPDYALAEAVNFPLGGIYTSDLNTELRVNKGYTYGIRSGFEGGREDGLFSVSTSVRSNVTADSLRLIREILGNYGPGFDADKLATLREARVRGEALKSETLGAKLEQLRDMAEFGFAPDYRRANAQALEGLTLEGVRRLSETFIDPDTLAYLVVGDAETQLESVRELGLPLVELE